MTDRRRHVVCLTGNERSFSEIGHNVREGVLRMHGTPSIAFVGVRPANDAWPLIRRLLPLDTVAVQRQCWTPPMLNTTASWLRCDMRGRPHDCRASFLQQLCDMQLCEELISRHEREHKGGRPFSTAMRLRPDLFWETAVSLPRRLGSREIFVPGSDSQGGVNDHLAVGARKPMRRYFTRLRHVTAPAIAALVHLTTRSSLRGHTGEGHLWLALKRDDVKPQELKEWGLCLHTRRALKARSGFRGCIGRVRCRSVCASLICAKGGFKCAASDPACPAYPPSAPSLFTLRSRGARAGLASANATTRPAGPSLPFAPSQPCRSRGLRAQRTASAGSPSGGTARLAFRWRS